MENKNWYIGKEIKDPIAYNEETSYCRCQMEVAIPISQNQLNSAKLFNSKYEYAKTLNKDISYLEIGVGYGQSAQMFINTTNAKSADLLDLYENADGVRHPGGSGPNDNSMTHEEYVKDKFSYHSNVRTIKGDAMDTLFALDKMYDLVFFDSISKRFLVRSALKHCSKLVNIGGIIGFTSYMNYDAVNYEKHVGIYQSVNEFLHFNRNWSVDAIVLHNLGFHEIYIKRNSQ